MKRRTLLSLLASFGLVLGGVAAQSVFYVDAKTGNDLNSGTTPTRAWKSLKKASSALPKNSVLLVMPGTYSVNTTNELWPVTFGISDQSNCKIIAVGGPAVTIIDGGGSSSLGLVRFRSNARKLRFTGFTFQNMGTASFFSTAIRMGSYTGGVYSCSDVEVDHCVFKNVWRALVIFGSQSGTLISTGNRFHDNLILNSKGQSIAAYGKGINYIYNNTIVKSAHDGIFLSDSAVKEYCGAVVYNNLCYGGGTTGILADATAFNATKTLGPKVLHNAAFLNTTAQFSGFPVGKTNLSVDPLFVNLLQGDFRLKATSPLIDAGTNAFPVLRHDADAYPRAFDAKGKGRVADIGAYEFHRNDMTVTVPLKVGTTGNVKFTGPPGAGLVLFALDDGALLTPYGILLIDLPTFIPALTAVGGIPGNRAILIPNIPSLAGLRLVLQGAWLNPTKGLLELLNVSHQVL